MRGVRVCLLAEVYRLVHTRATWWTALFLAAVSAARVLATRASEAVRQAERLATGLGPDSAAGEIAGASGQAWAPFVDGWRTGLTAGTLLLLLHAARTIAADRESGVLRVALTRSTSRGGAVLARALLAVPLIGAVFVASGAAALGVAAFYYDFGPLVEDGYELLSAAELRGELLRASLAVLPALAATYAFGLLVSAALRSAALSVAVALSAFLSFDLFKETLGRAQYWVFASFAPSFVDGSALKEMSGVARGYSDAGFPAELLRMNWILPWPQAVLFVALACVSISRRAS